MNLLINGTINEIVKLARKKRILIVALLSTILIIGIFIYRHLTGAVAQNPWTIQVTSQLRLDQTSYSSAPVFFKAELLNKIKFLQYELNHNVSVNQHPSPFFANLVGPFFILLLPLFVIILGGDIINGEVTDGTMKAMLLRPLGRKKIYMAKSLALVIILFFIEIYQEILIYIGDLSFGEWNPFSGSVLLGYEKIHGMIQLSSLYTLPTWLVILIAHGLALITIVCMISIILMISTLIRNPAISVTTSVVLLFLFPILTSQYNLNWINDYTPYRKFDLVSQLTGYGGMIPNPLNLYVMMVLLLLWSILT